MKKLGFSAKLCAIMTALASCTAQVAEADQGIKLVCGIKNVEDLVALPGSPWIIGGGVGNQFLQSGALHLINAETMVGHAVKLDMPQGVVARAPFDQCPGPVSPDIFSAHGIALTPNADGTYRLYVVNHGARESIELFEVKKTAVEPTFTWIGCILSPPTGLANALDVLPDGSLVMAASFAADHQLPSYREMSTLSSGKDKKAEEKDDSEESGTAKSESPTPMGALFTWSRQLGWKKVPNGEFPINNGVLVSKDGKWAYVNAWLGKSVSIIPLDTAYGKARTVKLEFMPDNMRWSHDGKVISTGQIAEMQQIEACVYRGDACIIDYKAVEIDPTSLVVTTLYSGKGTEKFGAATVGLKTPDALWLGSLHSECVARVPSGDLYPSSSDPS